MTTIIVCGFNPPDGSCSETLWCCLDDQLPQVVVGTDIMAWLTENRIPLRLDARIGDMCRYVAQPSEEQALLIKMRWF